MRGEPRELLLPVPPIVSNGIGVGRSVILPANSGTRLTPSMGSGWPFILKPRSSSVVGK